MDSLKKKNAGEKAVEYIEDGMTLGLGSGSTIYWMMKRLSVQIQNGLSVKGIPTSKRTEGWAREFGIPLTEFAEIEKIDLAIDGANEIDPNLNLIKGGGGSLVREKIVNEFAERLLIIADDGKFYNQLGKHLLPVEVIPFGWEVTARNLEKLGCTTNLRMQDNNVFISDNENYIVDCQFDSIQDPVRLHEELKLLVGVIETGLFCNMVDQVIIGKDSKVELLR
ncbi:ribose 5-phosphate isomerase A [Virgibacillus ainsalahensis]